MKTKDTKEFLDAYRAWSSDELKKYQTKITRIANSINNDVVNNNNVRPLFSMEERETLENAVKILNNFKHTVAHGKEILQREENKKEAARKRSYSEATKLVEEAFKLESVTEKTIFSLCVERVIKGSELCYVGESVDETIDDHIFYAKDIPSLEIRARNTTRRIVERLVEDLITYDGLNKDRLEIRFKSITELMENMHKDDKASLNKLTDFIAILTSENVVKLKQ